MGEKEDVSLVLCLWCMMLFYLLLVGPTPSRPHLSQDTFTPLQPVSYIIHTCIHTLLKY